MYGVVTIDKRVIGSEKNLIVDCSETPKLSWSDDVVQWHLSGGKKKSSLTCLDSLFEVESEEFPIKIPEKYKIVAKTVVGEDYGSVDIPWKSFMTSDDYKKFIRESVESVIDAVTSVDDSYFKNVYTRTESVFDSLRRMRIDKSKLEESINDESSDSQRAALKSFFPDDSGFCNFLKYSRLTRTGRTVVLSGPQILTVRKEYRELLESSYVGGKIYSIDFVGLEGRISYIEGNGRLDARDVYEHVNEKFFRSSLDRTTVKVAVLCELFGMGDESLAEKLGVSVKNAEKFALTLRKLFGIDELSLRLRKEFIDSRGFIRSKFGRRIPVPELRLLINSYVQSSGVDVSLLGFLDILSKLPKDVRPIAVIHDDVLLDVPPHCFREVESIDNVRVVGYDEMFPVKVKRLEQNISS